MHAAQIQSNLRAAEAHLRGEPIEIKTSSDGDWRPTTSLENFDRYWFRVAPPEPQAVPWNCAEDVPGPVCWIRWVHLDEVYMVIAVYPYGFRTSATGKIQAWKDLSQFEHSTDRKTWKPCTKLA